MGYIVRSKSDVKRCTMQIDILMFFFFYSFLLFLCINFDLTDNNSQFIEGRSIIINILYSNCNSGCCSKRRWITKLYFVSIRYHLLCLHKPEKNHIKCVSTVNYTVHDENFIQFMMIICCFCNNCSSGDSLHYRANHYKHIT